jgi:hypothetical protein
MVPRQAQRATVEGAQQPSEDEAEQTPEQLVGDEGNPVTKNRVEDQTDYQTEHGPDECAERHTARDPLHRRPVTVTTMRSRHSASVGRVAFRAVWQSPPGRIRRGHLRKRSRYPTSARLRGGVQPIGVQAPAEFHPAGPRGYDT